MKLNGDGVRRCNDEFYEMRWKQEPKVNGGVKERNRCQKSVSDTN